MTRNRDNPLTSDLDHDADSTQHFVSQMWFFLTTLILCCIHQFPLFIAFKLAHANIKSCPLQCAFSNFSSFPILRCWVLDSACAFPFTFNPPTTTFCIFI
jgi:hypothetical protein